MFIRSGGIVKVSSGVIHADSDFELIQQVRPALILKGL
jgi:hypothetical protein